MGSHRADSRASRDQELADIYSFLLWQRGDPVDPFLPRFAAR